MKCAWLLAAIVWLMVSSSARADDGITAEIAQINTAKYPEVTLYVSVVDRAGHIVEGLAQDDFWITEEGVAVELIAFSAGSHAAIATVLTIDHSGSMSVEGKMEGAKTAATTFVDLMRLQDRAALVVFDDKVATLQPFTSDKNALKTQIRSLGPGGCTAWYDGVYASVDLIAPLEGRRSVILLSDGIDCREDLARRLMGSGSSHTLDEAIGRAKSAGIPVYAIGLGRQASERVSNEGFDVVKLRRVAGETGGKFYHAPSSAELKELYRSLSIEMQKEYILTYRSPRPTYDGTRRDIVVSIERREGGGATTRGGYLEKHLINIRSDWRWFLALLVPLLLALAIPVVLQRGIRVRRRVPTPGVASPVVASTPDIVPMAPVGHKVGPAPPASVESGAPQMACPECGSPLRPGAKFCGACGHMLAVQPVSITSTPPSPAGSTPAPQVRTPDYCPDCGHPLRLGARFCGGCGRRF